MIQIQCTNCKTLLSIDDAFAGGVCRCQHCGTIQTVPKHLKNVAATEGMHAKAAGGGSPAALYRNQGKGDVGLSSGLDAIADVVASSGLAGSGLSRNEGRRPKLHPAGSAAAAAGGKNKMIPVLVVTGIVIILLLGVVIGLLVKGSGGEGKQTPPPQANATPAAPVAPVPAANLPTTPVANPIAPPRDTTPTFFGLKLGEPTIVFVLDRGSAMHDSFDFMKNACLNTLDSLRPNQKCQVIFWKLDKEKDLAAYPGALTAAGNKDEMRKADKAIDDVNCFGVSDLKPALDKAFAAKPAVVVIVTSKPLDGGFVKTVMDARKNAGVKVDCVSLVEPASRSAMEDVAKQTKGTFKFVSLSELRSVSR